MLCGKPEGWEGFVPCPCGDHKMCGPCLNETMPTQIECKGQILYVDHWIDILSPENQKIAVKKIMSQSTEVITLQARLKCEVAECLLDSCPSCGMLYQDHTDCNIVTCRGDGKKQCYTIFCAVCHHHLTVMPPRCCELPVSVVEDAGVCVVCKKVGHTNYMVAKQEMYSHYRIHGDLFDEAKVKEARLRRTETKLTDLLATIWTPGILDGTDSSVIIKEILDRNFEGHLDRTETVKRLNSSHRSTLQLMDDLHNMNISLRRKVDRMTYHGRRIRTNICVHWMREQGKGKGKGKGVRAGCRYSDDRCRFAHGDAMLGSIYDVHSDDD